MVDYAAFSGFQAASLVVRQDLVRKFFLQYWDEYSSSFADSMSWQNTYGQLILNIHYESVNLHDAHKFGVRSEYWHRFE